MTGGDAGWWWVARRTAGTIVIDNGGMTVSVRLRNVRLPCSEPTVQSVMVLLPIVARAKGFTW